MMGRTRDRREKRKACSSCLSETCERREWEMQCNASQRMNRLKKEEKKLESVRAELLTRSVLETSLNMYGT